MTWRETPSAQRETLIKNGEVDMIAATYSINKGRYKSVDFGVICRLTKPSWCAKMTRSKGSAIWAQVPKCAP